jgi:hypothetical protein
MLKPWEEQADADEDGPSASKRPKTKCVNVLWYYKKKVALLVRFHLLC